jgi:soluble lytic murein transglycosylase-like protein
VPRLRLALVAAVLVLGAALLYVTQSGGPDEDVPVIPTPPGAERGEAVADPFAYSAETADELTRRAAAGTSQVLYTRSPGGAAESAIRVARFREPVEAAARTAGVNPDLLEALVFLESAGRPDARAPGGIEGAAGLTQILGETGQNLLDMEIDLERSGSYTRRLERAQREGNAARVRALTRARARVDDRFVPAKALEATARYLKLALSELYDREDLAFVSYHMGIGNLQNVIEAFGGGPRSYAELYFDSTPQRHREAFEKLASFGDDSSNYFWKLLAARNIMRAHRTDPAALARTAAERAQDESGRERLLAGLPQGDLRTLKATPQNTGLEVVPGLELRDEAAAVAAYIGSQVRSILGGRGALRVTGTADGGWSFRVSRDYASERQALAFQFVLDRLTVLNVIAWSRSERTIRVTAGRDADVLKPLLDRLG